jgi:uncharacterized membrane-anchored protein
MPIRLLTLVTLLALIPTAFAQESGEGMTAKQFEASLHYQDGHIKLPGDRASLDMPPSFRYLGPDDSHRVLVQAWGNPPGEKPLGMLVPSDESPLSLTGWAVVITYSHDGHISDADADAINYDELLAQMRQASAEANAERQRLGYEPVELLGWAEPPHYDRASHKLYWAKDLKVGNNDQRTLNYSIRILGREGVLVLNAVAGIDQLERVKGRMQEVLAFTNFDSGHRYTDFNPSTDKVAAYGLAALIGGAVAAKAGLFAKLLALLVAGKKLIGVVVIALGAGLVRLFRKKRAAA